MLFASSKDALRRALQGIATDIQATDFSEIAHESGQLAFISATCPIHHLIRLHFQWSTKFRACPSNCTGSTPPTPGFRLLVSL